MFKRFAQNKRGVSTIIGAIFFVLVLLGGFSMIIWEVNQYDAYVQVVSERDRLDWEKQNEIIEIVSVYVLGDSLNVSVINKGAVAAHLVDLWVTEYSTNEHRLFEIDYYVNPGDTVTGIGQGIETLEIDPKLTYVVKVVTKRGNIATGTSEVPELPPPVHSFGVFSLDWFYFKYSSKQTYQNNPEEPRQSAGVISKAEDYIAFYIKVTNNYDETMTIKSTSMIMLLIEWQEPLFYIVKNVSYDPASINEYNDGDPITIGPHESMILTFASKGANGTEWAWGNSPWPNCGWWGCDELPIGIAEGDTPEGAIVMTALVFTMETTPTQIYAQSLPFQALVLSGD